MRCTFRNEVLLFDSTRRRFLLDGSKTVAGAMLLSPPPRALALHSKLTDGDVPISVRRLDAGWAFHQGSLRIEDIWRSDQAESWGAVQLPHCFNSEDACDPDRPYFRGQGWYRTRLKVENPFAGGRTLLHFNGAGQTTSVWVGETLAASHKGGYDEFSVDITDLVDQGRVADAQDGIPVAVCCDNSSDRDRVPSDLSDFCLYGGVYRHAQLVYLPAIALDCVHVLPSKSRDGSWQAAVKARLYNPGNRSELLRLSIKILSPAGAVVHETLHTSSPWAGLTEIATVHLTMPELWTPETPHLYRCRVSLSSAAGQVDLDERFGVRHYEFVEHGPFLLNGKRVLLRGTQRHADHAGVAAAMSDDLVRREMKLIRDMGANFIRLAHYQQDRLVLDLCDELGLMVWEEAPWCRAGVGDAAFRDNAKAMLSAMIDQHYNHPSIILWGLGNEDDWPNEFPEVDQQAIRQFMTEMRDLAHELDSSRLTAFRRCEFARDIPDVYSPSIWAGWYRGNYREYEQSLLEQRQHVKRFIHMEWGADSQRGRHSENPEAALDKVPTGSGVDERGLDYMDTGGEARMSTDGDYSESYACNLFDWYLKTQEKLDWLTGSAQWVFKDFASPLRVDNAIPRINMKGVVERDFTFKEAYFVFQSYWAEKPMVHIYGHTWPVRWGAPGEKRVVHVYSNCCSVELFLNGKSLGTKQRNSQDFPAAGLRWDVIFASGENRLYTVAHRGAAQVADEIKVRYQSESWSAPHVLELKTVSRHGSVVTIEAKMFDAKGVQCLDAAHPIRFSLEGAGRMIDNLGTSRGSRALKLANGRAETSVICSGPCTLSAAAEGIPPAKIGFS
jgi:beta-galactosidase